MALGNLQGHARTNSKQAEAKGVCDRCGFWYPLSSLQRQFQWAGANLFDTGYLVCPDRCLDKPFEQYKVLILPPDPLPRENSRPDQTTTGPAFVGSFPPTTPGNSGFFQYVLNSAIPPLYPTDKPTVLADVAALSGIPTPSSIIDRSITLAAQNTPQLIIGAAGSKSWILLYNPAVPQIQISLAPTRDSAWGVVTNIAMGPGEAYFAAAATGLGTPWQGAITVIGQQPGVPVFAWEAP